MKQSKRKIRRIEESDNLKKANEVKKLSNWEEDKTITGGKSE